MTSSKPPENHEYYVLIVLRKRHVQGSWCEHPNCILILLSLSFCQIRKFQKFELVMITSLIIGIFQLAFGAKICYNYNGEVISGYFWVIPGHFVSFGVILDDIFRVWPRMLHGRATMGRNGRSSKSSFTSSPISGRSCFQTWHKKRDWTCCWLWRFWFNFRIRFWWRQAPLFYHSRIFWLRNGAKRTYLKFVSLHGRSVQPW